MKSSGPLSGFPSKLLEWLLPKIILDVALLHRLVIEEMAQGLENNVSPVPVPSFLDKIVHFLKET